MKPIITKSLTPRDIALYLSCSTNSSFSLEPDSYHVHKNPPLVPIPNHMNPVYQWYTFTV